MATQTFTITIDDDYQVPEGSFLTNEQYIDFIVNMAAWSYKHQYVAGSPLAGVTAAREAYNEALPEAGGE